jgi:hypothetical protein
MSLGLQPAQVATGATTLRASLSSLTAFSWRCWCTSPTSTRRMRASWFLEAGFGRIDDPRQPKFADLDKAQDWIMQRLAGAPVHG